MSEERIARLEQQVKSLAIALGRFEATPVMLRLEDNQVHRVIIATVKQPPPIFAATQPEPSNVIAFPNSTLYTPPPPLSA